MNLRSQILAVTLATLLLLAGVVCLALRHGESAATGQARSLREVTDMTGERVRIPATPRRVLSLWTAATDTVLSLGASDRLTALDRLTVAIHGP